MNIPQISIKRPVFVTAIVVLMMLVGLFSFSKLGVDLFPDVSFPVVSIQTVYPGASPNDIEELVSKPIEDELGSIAGLKRLSSQNLESVSFVVAEFVLGSDVKYAEQQIRNRLGNIRRNLPQDIEEPLIRQLDPSDQPILRIGVMSKLPPAELYDIVDQRVKSAFERLDGVGLVEIVGGRKREVKVLVDGNKLKKYEIPMTQLAARLQSSSANVPVGKSQGGSKDTVYRSVGEFANLDSIRKVVVNFMGSDRPVRLSDVATVEDGLEEEKSRSTLNGEPAVYLDIYRQSGSNTVAVADRVKAAMAKLEPALKAEKVDATLKMVRDMSYRIKINVDDVKESIALGVFFCIIVVFFFLGSFKSTLITSLALPNSLLGAFILMYLMGFTINIMTLLAMSLAVGLLIDDAIVVRENIFRHMELGSPPRKAAEEGTNEVALAVVATTLVVMAVFGPIAFLSGIVGQFFRQFGLTVVFAMAVSLFDAMTVAPMLSAYWADDPKDHHAPKGFIGRMLSAFDRFQTKLEDIYEHAIRFTLKRPKTVLAGGMVVFVASLALVAGIPKTFLPPQDVGDFEVRLETDPGTSLESMAVIADAVDADLRKHPAVLLTSTAVGTKEGESNKATIYISLKPTKQRKGFTTMGLKDEYRKKLHKEYVETNKARVTVADFDAFGGGQRPFNLYLNGSNLQELSDYAEKLKARMAQIPGFVDVDTNYRAGKPEFQVVFNREKAESLGVSMATAGMELRSRVEGVTPATYRLNGEEYDVRLQMAEPFRELQKDFNTIVVPNVNFNLIPLASIAEGKLTSGFSQINRQNKGRYVNISGDLGPNGALGAIMDQTKAIIEKEMPPPPGVTWAFVGQAEDFKDLMTNMIIAVMFGVAFIYLVLASLYESFVTPFTILLALPLAVCGAFAALYVTGESINIFSIIGMIMLLGVVTKNSILVVDYTLQLTEAGMTRSDALMKACRTRLRPILMTSIALVAGVIPIAIGLNEASKQRTAMGVALIGGLLSSTLLTLLIVPAAYGYIDDFRKWCLKIARGKRGTAERG